ncbi:hypothetical protein Csa_015151 [Cucumis sativus]|uniref:Uncharacterized protein n=1 Tax=Cucumis sativus TaxID=3659 RepID=A0A0A0KT46_CUCSA|nr:hypothetical protein Csa_015151 [Cucumis sativus]
MSYCSYVPLSSSDLSHECDKYSSYICFFIRASQQASADPFAFSLPFLQLQRFFLIVSSSASSIGSRNPLPFTLFSFERVDDVRRYFAQ